MFIAFWSYVYVYKVTPASAPSMIHYIIVDGKEHLQDDLKTGGFYGNRSFHCTKAQIRKTQSMLHLFGGHSIIQHLSSQENSRSTQHEK